MSPTKPWLGKCLKNDLPHHSGCVFGLPAAGNSPSPSWKSLWIVTPSSKVDDDLPPLGRPQLERVADDRRREQAAVVGDLRELHALLAVGQPVLALQLVAAVAEVAGGLRAAARDHERQLVDARDRAVEEAEAVLAPLDLEHRVGRAVDGEDVADEAVVGEVLEERLAPPLGVRLRVAGSRELALGVVDVLVDRGAVVQPAVVDRQRDVEVHVERAVGVVGADTRQPQALGLVAGVEVVLGVVDRVEADHSLVDVRPGVVHPVVVEPEEALL